LLASRLVFIKHASKQEAVARQQLISGINVKGSVKQNKARVVARLLVNVSVTIMIISLPFPHTRS